MPKHLAVFAIFLLVASGLFGETPPTPDQFRQYLQNSAALSQLEMDGMAPFHLKASLEWLSSAGKSTDRGTIEVLWKDSHHNRITLALPSGKLVENDDGENPWRTGRWSYLVVIGLAEHAVLSPFIEAHLLTDRVSEGIQLEGKPAMDCIDTAPDIPGVSPAAKIAPTTYCLSRGNHILRLVRRPNNWTIAFNDIKGFGSKSFARSITIGSGGMPVAWLHVDLIEKAEDFSVLSEAAPDGAQLLHFHRADGPYLSGEVMRGTPIYRTPPLINSSLGHSGIVVIKVHIDTTGTVSSTEVVDSPSEFLSAAAVSQVRQWRYSLSYVNGKIVPIDDVVRILFK